MAASRPNEAAWQVRIWNAEGQVTGAGVLISTRHVVTCAHVVDPLAAEAGEDLPAHVSVKIDFPMEPMRGPLGARVVKGGWFPVGDHGEGDIAVLELDSDVDGIPAARLSVPKSYLNRQVSVLGYPESPPLGVWAEAKLQRRTAPGWVQLDAQAVTGQRIEKGFSGAGVMDVDDGTVVGIVVTELINPTAKVAWMLPVETIAACWPPLADRVEHADGLVSINQVDLVAVAECSAWPGGHEITAVTASGGLLRRWWGPDRWSQWYQAEVETEVQDVATASFDSGRITCVITDVNGRAWRASSDDRPGGTHWSSWYQMRPLAITASPALIRVAAVSKRTGHQEMFAVTGAGELVHRWNLTGEWSDWQSLDAPIAMRDVAAASPADGQILCVAVDVHGRAWHRSSVESKWSDWTKIGPPQRTASPVLVRVSAVSGWRGEDGHKEIFAVTSAGELIHRWWKKSQEWSHWYIKETPVPVRDVAATSNNKGHIECVIAGTNGRLYQQWFSKEMRWSAWNSINDLLQNS